MFLFLALVYALGFIGFGVGAAVFGFVDMIHDTAGEWFAVCLRRPPAHAGAVFRTIPGVQGTLDGAAGALAGSTDGAD